MTLLIIAGIICAILSSIFFVQWDEHYASLSAILFLILTIVFFFCAGFASSIGISCSMADNLNDYEVVRVLHVENSSEQSECFITIEKTDGAINLIHIMAKDYEGTSSDGYAKRIAYKLVPFK